MSGEAGAGMQSTHYYIYYSSGMTVSVAEPTFDEEEEQRDYTAEYFESENKVYQEKLEKLKGKLDAVFSKFIKQKNLPLLECDQNAHYSVAAIIENTDKHETNLIEERELESLLSQQTQVKLLISWSFNTANFQQLSLSITTSERVGRKKINNLEKAIVSLF